MIKMLKYELRNNAMPLYRTPQSSLLIKIHLFLVGGRTVVVGGLVLDLGYQVGLGWGGVWGPWRGCVDNK